MKQLELLPQSWRPVVVETTPTGIVYPTADSVSPYRSQEKRQKPSPKEKEKLKLLHSQLKNLSVTPVRRPGRCGLITMGF